MAAILIEPGRQFADSNGDPAPAGSLFYLYDEQTSTLKTGYSDPNLTVPMANPFALDAAGRLENNTVCYVPDGERYFWRVTNSSGATIAEADRVWGHSETGTTTATSITDLKAISATNDQVVTIPGKGVYTFSASSTATPDNGTVILPDSGSGRWLREAGTVHPELFDAAGDNLTDDTAAFTSLGTAVAQDTRFKEKTYRLYPTVTASIAMMTLTDREGVTIDGGGATLNIEGTISGTDEVTLFKLVNCRNITIKNIRVIGVVESLPLSSVRGIVFCNMRNGCENIRFENIEQNTGVSGMECVRAPATEGVEAKCRGIEFINCEFNNVAYPLSFQYSGDQVFARNVRIDTCERAYFPYGVSDHDVYLNVKDGVVSPVCNISVFNTDSTTNVTQNMKLNVTSEGNTPGNQRDLVGLNWLHDPSSGSGGGTIRNVELDVTTDYDNTSANYSAVSAEKTVSGGGLDSTQSRGHVAENINIRMSMRGSTVGNLGKIDLFNVASQGDWTGETIRGVTLDGVKIDTDGGLRIDGTAFEDALVVRDCTIPDAISMASAFTQGVVVENSSIDGVYYREANLSTDPTIQTGLANDGSPSVAGISVLTTANTGLTPITTFDDGTNGQELTLVIGDANTTVDFTGTNLKGNGGVDWSPASGDFMRCKFDGTNWYCVVTTV